MRSTTAEVGTALVMLLGCASLPKVAPSSASPRIIASHDLGTDVVGGVPYLRRVASGGWVMVDFDCRCVRVVGADGVTKTTIGEAANGALTFPVSAIVSPDGVVLVAEATGWLHAYSAPYHQPSRSFYVGFVPYDIAVRGSEIYLAGSGPRDFPYWIHRFDFDGQRVGQGVPLDDAGAELRQTYKFTMAGFAFRGDGTGALASADTPGVAILDADLAVVRRLGQVVPPGVLMPQQTSDFPPADPSRLQEELIRISNQWDSPVRTFFVGDAVAIVYLQRKHDVEAREAGTWTRQFLDVVDARSGERLWSGQVEGRVMDISAAGTMTVVRSASEGDLRHTWIDEYSLSFLDSSRRAG